MRHISSNISIIRIYLIFIIIIQYEQSNAQSNDSKPIEVAKCVEVKKRIFEKVYTASGFLRDANDLKITEDKCKQFAPFIVGGTPASPKEFPHIARLGHKEDNSIKWLCGGTLISEKFVLTAAHCFYTKFQVNTVRLGELDFDQDDEDAHPQDFKVRRTVIHKDYNHTLVYNDIALIELDASIAFDEYIHPACLPTSSGAEFNRFLVIGWGQKQFRKEESQKLLKVTLNRFDYARCKDFADGEDEKFPTSIDDRSQMCAGSHDTKDTCCGDSGGPLLSFHPDYPCMYTVIGITSYGIGCGTPDQPGVYTRVHNYINWIRSTVWN